MVVLNLAPPARPVSPAADPRLVWIDAPSADPTRTVATHFRAILEALGLDLADPNLADAPERVARMYTELFSGLREGARPKLTTFPNTEAYSQMVSVQDIPFFSVC